MDAWEVCTIQMRLHCPLGHDQALGDFAARRAANAERRDLSPTRGEETAVFACRGLLLFRI